MSAWTRVTRAHPCPVCGKDKWCVYNAEVAICRKVPSDRTVATGIGPGYLHRLDGLKGPPFRRAPRQPLCQTRSSTDLGPSPGHQEWLRLARRFYAHPDAQNQRWELAQRLGVSAAALEALSCGWTGQYWTFPIKDGAGQFVGLQRRYMDGAKLTWKGGHRGIFYAGDPRGVVYLVEGPSDVAALLTVKAWGIGRFSNYVGAQEAAQVLGNRELEVVVVAERDQKDGGSWPGMEGAQHCAKVLLQALGRPVTIACPPEPYKDVRDWVKGGADAGALRRDLDRFPVGV